MLKNSFFKKGERALVRRGQSIIEMTFAMVMILFMIYGLVRASRWVVLDAADRRYRYDALLRVNHDAVDDAAAQMNPAIYRVRNPDLEYRTANTQSVNPGHGIFN